jgi:aryl-alcohol dehydrogenase-like predicted oxidoreductase
MGMSEFYGAGDDDESLATIRLALDRGYGLLDTADMYGPFTNERLVGRAVAGRREDAVIATKFGIERLPDGSRRINGRRTTSGRPATARSSGSASRRSTSTTSTGSTRPSRSRRPGERCRPWSPPARSASSGISEASPATIRRAHAVHPVAALQTEWSLWTRDPEDELLPTVRELGIAFVPYSPLGRGFLTGQIRSTDGLADDDFRRNNPRFQEENLARNLSLVTAVEEMAGAKGCTPGQLALAWLLHQGDDVVPIPGTKRRSRLTENLAAVDVRLDDDDLVRLDHLAPPGAASGERYPDMSHIDR